MQLDPTAVAAVTLAVLTASSLAREMLQEWAPTRLVIRENPPWFFRQVP